MGGDAGAGVGLALSALLALALVGGRRWRRAALLVAAVAAVGCASAASDGAGGAEQTRLTVGRWSSIAAADGRVVVAGYESRFGDLVVGAVDGAGGVTFTPIDGVPDQPAVDDGAYRGGRTGAGPDVGAYASVGLVGGRGWVAYQDRDRGSLRLAIEAADGSWASHEVDAPAGGALGLYASLVVGERGLPAIAYMAAGLPGDGAEVAQLRWAEATTDAPAGSADWRIEVVAEVAVAPAALPYEDLPQGLGLYASADRLPDGTPVIAFYDRERGALALAQRGDAWLARDLDVENGGDLGRWASLVADAAGVIHVAYQDARRGQLRYLRVVDGAVDGPQVVDDGARDGVRHEVGAGAALAADDGAVAIAYQDAFDVDALLAERAADGSWRHRALLSGAIGYGFSLSAARSAGVLWVSSHAYDRRRYPPGTLAIAHEP